MSDTELVPDIDEGTMEDLVNSLFEPEPVEDSESTTDAATTEETPDETEGVANPETDSTESDQSTATPEELEIERLKKDAELGRQMRNTLWQNLSKQQQQQQQQQQVQHQQAAISRIAALAEEVDPDRANERAKQVYDELRLEMANAYLPQLDAAETEHDRAAQGVVVLHATIQEMLSPEQLLVFEQKVNKRLQYGDIASLNRAIEDERAAEERIRSATADKDAEIERLSLRLQALERVRGGADDVPGFESDSPRIGRTTADVNADDNATVDDLVDSISY